MMLFCICVPACLCTCVQTFRVTFRVHPLCCKFLDLPLTNMTIFRLVIESACNRNIVVHKSVNYLFCPCCINIKSNQSSINIVHFLLYRYSTDNQSLISHILPYVLMLHRDLIAKQITNRKQINHQPESKQFCKYMYYVAEQVADSDIIWLHYDTTCILSRTQRPVNTIHCNPLLCIQK